MGPIKSRKDKTLTPKQLDGMRASGKVTSNCLEMLSKMVAPGVTGLELDVAAYKFIVNNQARPAFLNYMEYPNTLCVGINNVVIHGIPNNKPLEEGDIVSLDVGVNLNGWFTDAAITVPVGKVDDNASLLLEVTRKSLQAGLDALKAGALTGEVGAAVEEIANEHIFEVIDGYHGHGIGNSLHLDPEIPNRGPAEEGVKLLENQVICVEPILSPLTNEAVVEDDDWTVTTKDGSLAAHFEQAVIVTKDGYESLTPHDFLDK